MSISGAPLLSVPRCSRPGRPHEMRCWSASPQAFLRDRCHSPKPLTRGAPGLRHGGWAKSTKRSARTAVQSSATEPSNAFWRRHPADREAHLRPGSDTPVNQRAIRRLAVRSDGGARRLRAAPQCGQHRLDRPRGPRVCLCRAPGEFGNRGSTPDRSEARVGDVAR
jgi:hypothetical protein